MREKLRYKSMEDCRLSERADWFGAYCGLERHFHDEIQVSWLECGERRYFVGQSLINIHADQILILPPLCVHKAMPTFDSLTRSTEFYIKPSEIPLSVHAAIEDKTYIVLDAPWLRDTQIDNVPTSIIDMLLNLNSDRQPPDSSQILKTESKLMLPLLTGASIAQIAVDLNFTREGYIRAFTRHFGMTPHAYRLNMRLNQGRALLRNECAVGDAAAAAGFCDQSHFGRFFLSFFGSTPGQFRSVHVR